ncbi:hypothetical protein N9769_01160 [Ascidiaceihabitans sp.]|nr:hypothetical protein [Ascidiaceihabitans sp.]
MLAVIIPIFRKELPNEEIENLKHSLGFLKGTKIFFIHPSSLDLSFYKLKFTNFSFSSFPDKFFKNIEGYNKLMTSNDFYRKFLDFEFMLILQTDAILNAPINLAEEFEFDYIGAPWISPFTLSNFHFGAGYAFFAGRVLAKMGIGTPVQVGNGGLSLRRTSAFSAALHSAELLSLRRNNMPEDIFFAGLGSIYDFLRVADLDTAHKFFCEGNCSNSDPLHSKGYHALSKYNPLLRRDVLERKL